MTDDKDQWFNPGTAKVNGEIDISCDTLYCKNLIGNKRMLQTCHWCLSGDSIDR